MVMKFVEGQPLSDLIGNGQTVDEDTVQRDR